jgi:hypothetical protein
MRPSVVQGLFPRGLIQLAGARPGAGGTAVPLPPHLAHAMTLGGEPLPAPVRQRMESAFGATFHDVRVHVGPQASALGATAFTHGSHIHFAPGVYQPQTAAGQRILGHELAHVLQQRSGRVSNPFGSGVAIVMNAMLEAEADRMAQRIPIPAPAPHAHPHQHAPAHVPPRQAVQRLTAPPLPGAVRQMLSGSKQALLNMWTTQQFRDTHLLDVDAGDFDDRFGEAYERNVPNNTIVLIDNADVTQIARSAKDINDELNAIGPGARFDKIVRKAYIARSKYKIWTRNKNGKISRVWGTFRFTGQYFGGRYRIHHLSGYMPDGSTWEDAR